MAQADSKHTTPTSVDSSRRRFMAVTAAASAVSASAMAAAVVPHSAAPDFFVADDSALLKLEEEIFEQYWGAAQYNAEIVRLAEIWTTESKRLYDEALAKEAQAGVYLTARERWAVVTDLPECKEYDRLCQLQGAFFGRMEALIEEMFATPAPTAEGRRAKVMVLLSCIMGDEWCRVDDETDYRQLMARRLLIEFVGGDPGEMLRDQFA
jgi:hypothetical protein